MKTAKTLAFIAILLFIAYQFLRTDKFTEDPEQTVTLRQYNPNVVAYDWENDREITQQMLDTLAFSGGHWVHTQKGSKGYDTMIVKDIWIEKEHNWDWINPTGMERLYIPPGSNAERQWVKQNKVNRDLLNSKDNQVDEDRVREIIREEKDY